MRQSKMEECKFLYFTTQFPEIQLSHQSVFLQSYKIFMDFW